MFAKMTLMDDQTKFNVKSKPNSTDRRFVSCRRGSAEFLTSTSRSDNTKTFNSEGFITPTLVSTAAPAEKVVLSTTALALIRLGADRLSLTRKSQHFQL